MAVFEKSNILPFGCPQKRKKGVWKRMLAVPARIFTP